MVLNVTVVNPTHAGHLTVYPKGEPLPQRRQPQLRPGQTVPNRVMAKVGTNGQVMIHHGGAGTVDVVVDVGGWFTDSNSTAGGSRFTGLVPNRITDTRPGSTHVGPNATVAPNADITVAVAGTPGVPSMGSSTPPRAVVLNVAVTNPRAAGHLTVYPSDAPLPTAADQNWRAGDTRSNLVVAKLGADGAVKLRNASTGSTDFVIDVVGWYG